MKPGTKPSRANIKRRLQAAREAMRQALEMANALNAQHHVTYKMAESCDCIAIAAQNYGFELDATYRGGIR